MVELIQYCTSLQTICFKPLWFTQGDTGSTESNALAWVHEILSALPLSTQSIEMTFHLSPGTLERVLDWEQVDELLVGNKLPALREFKLYVYVLGAVVDVTTLLPRLKKKRSITTG